MGTGPERSAGAGKDSAVGMGSGVDAVPRTALRRPALPAEVVDALSSTPDGREAVRPCYCRPRRDLTSGHPIRCRTHPV